MGEVTVDKKEKTEKWKQKNLANVDNLKPEFSRYPFWEYDFKIKSTYQPQNDILSSFLNKNIADWFSFLYVQTAPYINECLKCRFTRLRALQYSFLQKFNKNIILGLACILVEKEMP
jgi:hypothetical protein